MIANGPLIEGIDGGAPSECRCHPAFAFQRDDRFANWDSANAECFSYILRREVDTASKLAVEDELTDIGRHLFADSPADG